MHSKLKKLVSMLTGTAMLAASIQFTAFADNAVISENEGKALFCNNQISSEIFCADPTAVEYNGRLYVYGTSDQQQYETIGPDGSGYGNIMSLEVFSTDDMENWLYHGSIDVEEIAPWIGNAWAPSIVSRVESDGLTHFYMYFSNGGLGTGVITATDPLGPWTDPLGEPLIDGTRDSDKLPAGTVPFDPGVVIDDQGDAWLAFGGGGITSDGGTADMPGTSFIVKLGDDMISFDSDFVKIPAPYFNEASELNYINGTYVYTYCSSWDVVDETWWNDNYDCAVPSVCSMIYMTTKTPLNPDSWEMKGDYFKNPGSSGLEACNNHTHLHKYKGQYYIISHAFGLNNMMGISGDYRSIYVDTINVDEETVTIEPTGATRAGVSSDINVSAYESNLGAELNNTADITLDSSDPLNPIAISDVAGAWTSVNNVEFTEQTTATAEPPEITGIDTITYHFDVKSVSGPTEISFYVLAKNAAEITKSFQADGPGEYSLTYELDGNPHMANMGYFRATEGTSIFMTLDRITINGKYNIMVNQRMETGGLDGLSNIWNEFNDNALVYSGIGCEFRYSKADDAINFWAVPQSEDSYEMAAPLSFSANVKGSGKIDVRLDARDGSILTSIEVNSPNAYQTEIGRAHV